MTEEKPVQKNDVPGETPGQDDPAQAGEPGSADALAARIAELEGTLSQYKDQLLRKAAEFDNYKKRVENDYASIVRYSNEDLILKLLPVLDDFERSFKMSRGSGDPAGERRDSGPDDESFRRGMELIYSKFKKLLDGLGVRPIEVLGKPFDPHFHDALLQIRRAGVPPHTVIEEVDKGYLLHDKVLRHSKVVVAADPPAGEESARHADAPEGTDAN